MTVNRATVRKNTDGVQRTELQPVGYTKGQTVTVYYDPTDPVGTASLQSDDWRVIGWVMTVLGALFLVGIWVRVYLVRRYRAFAAYEGATIGLNVITSQFIGPRQPVALV